LAQRKSDGFSRAVFRIDEFVQYKSEACFLFGRKGMCVNIRGISGASSGSIIICPDSFVSSSRKDWQLRQLLNIYYCCHMANYLKNNGRT